MIKERLRKVQSWKRFKERLNKRGWLTEIRRSLIRMREAEEGRGR